MKNIITVSSLKNNKEIILNNDCEVIGRFKIVNESIDSNINIIHQAPSIKTLIDIKAVLFENAHLKLSAAAKVLSGIKHINTYLSLRVLLVSKTASAQIIPIIEISENDVTGGHGATISYIDESQIYYMQSRGLDAQMCENLLIEAFLA
jgi:Fe-S cluster assembly protein SufD